MDGLWPDVLTNSKGKAAFNEATACNVDTLFHLMRRCFLVLALGYGGIVQCSTSICLLLSSVYPQENCNSGNLASLTVLAQTGQTCSNRSALDS